MTPIKEIGECVIGVGDQEFFFRPSFRNMTRIGEPEDIVRTYATLTSLQEDLMRIIQKGVEIHSKIPAHQREFYAKYFGTAELPGWANDALNSAGFLRGALLSAINVLQACSEDDVTELVGFFTPSKSRARTFVWHPGALPFGNMIIIAQNLMAHGVVGKAKVRKLQRHENNETTTEFHAAEYIMAARNHFGMSREEAENLTMTEFAMLINAKYPDQKGFTREEFDAVMDEDDRRWKAMMEREQAA